MRRMLTTASSSSVRHQSSPQLLLRDFIAKSLYGTTISRDIIGSHDAYFNQEQLVVSPPSMNFRDMAGFAEYQKALEEVYAVHGEGWSTPVELFKPHYAAAIGTHLLQTMDQDMALKVFEFGGGNGTCAQGILDHIQRAAPSVYATMEYTVVDISAAMHSRCKEVASSHEVIRLVHSSCLDWNEVMGDPCHVVALEMIDNMPHDKVTWTPDGAWTEAVVAELEGQYKEEQREVQDPLIKQALAHWLHLNGEPQISLWDRLQGRSSIEVWLPTATLRFFEVLREHLPRARLLLADFDELPSTVPGLYGPIVQRRDRKGGYEEFNSYMVQMGSCDIFFPTDFELLKRMHGEVLGIHSQVIKSSEFIAKYANVTLSRTKTGYNPMLEDYANTSFLVGGGAEL